VGLEKTARVLAAIGLKKESKRIAREAAAYRKDILASMDAGVLDRWGMKVLPMEPDTQRLLKGSNGRASGYYGLIASCMLESEFLPAADERTGWVMRPLEEKGGLRLLRMMLVREYGDRLWIGQAVPRHWMKEGNTIEVKEAATAFGPVSFSIRPHPGLGRIEVELTAPPRRTPKAVVLRLREPSGRKVATVKVNGRPIRSFNDDTVELQSPRGVLAIEVAY